MRVYVTGLACERIIHMELARGGDTLEGSNRPGRTLNGADLLRICSYFPKQTPRPLLALPFP